MGRLKVKHGQSFGGIAARRRRENFWSCTGFSAEQWSQKATLDTPLGRAVGLGGSRRIQNFQYAFGIPARRRREIFWYTLRISAEKCLKKQSLAHIGEGRGLVQHPYLHPNRYFRCFQPSRFPRTALCASKMILTSSGAGPARPLSVTPKIA